ncbi:MAG: MotA/TolQ/ExbB proton channel family protein [Myxococcales bacterium]|nr:MotA/TolQ/ExbB proton channel family protein [Myxococcales bacterium]
MNIVEKSKAVMLAMGAAPVMWLMIVLSVLSVAIILERGYFFYSIRDDLEVLARDLAKALRTGTFDDARRRLESSPSAEAAVVIAGLSEADRGAAAAEEAMAGATALQRMKLERRLVFLGTLGNNAPFIGLFGTVVGIIQAFQKLGESSKATATAAAASGGAPSEVMNAIAEALVATAIGLAVAIPAVAAFNFFQRLIKSTVNNTDALSRVLLAHLKGEGVDGAVAHASATRLEDGGRPSSPPRSERGPSASQKAAEKHTEKHDKNEKKPSSAEES